MQYQYFKAKLINTKRLNYISFSVLKVASYKIESKIPVLNPLLVKKLSAHFDIKVDIILMEHGN